MQELYIEPVAMDLAFNQPWENLKRIEAGVKARLAASPVPSEERLLLFPELSLTGFVTQAPAAFDLHGGDPLVERLRAIAAQNRTALAVGLPERNPRDAARPYNTLALLDPEGKIFAAYRKLHLFTLGAAPESACYSAGEKGVMAEYRGWKLGLSICFDLRFAGLYHQYARSGAELLLAPACWVGGPHKSEQFRTLGAAHAILSQAYLASVNRAGRDPAFEYDGAEYVFSPFGENLSKGGPCRLDRAELEACRRLAVRSADRPAYQVEGGI